MGDHNSLLEIIANYFREYKAYHLPDISAKYGLECNNDLDPMASKRLYLESGLKKKSYSELTLIAKKSFPRNAIVILLGALSPFWTMSFSLFLC